MKRCAHCQEIKPLEEFAWANKILKTRQKQCRDCMAEFNRNSYLRRSEQRKQEVKEYNRARIEAAQRYVWDYLLTHPCIDCGESDPRVLEFDHIKGEKHMAVSDMVTHTYSIERIADEISKCVVRCANCHRRKTHKERGWFSG